MAFVDEKRAALCAEAITPDSLRGLGARCVLINPQVADLFMRGITPRSAESPNGESVINRECLKRNPRENPGSIFS